MYLAKYALEILKTPRAADKAALTFEVTAKWRDGGYEGLGSATPPDRPARPEAPPLLLPQDMPKRKINRGTLGRIALLHALAHIELNAIDLAWDLVIRYPHENMPDSFINDWIQVADDEARHFLMLEERLYELDSYYGALPAHDGLWKAAEDTAYDIKARLAIVPMILEARGLDVTPATVVKLRSVDDDKSADLLQTIHDEEIDHVLAGKKGFDYLCARDETDPVSTWQALVKKHFKGGVKGPFNVESRNKANFGPEFYNPESAS